jgi:hypothetical protein
MNEKGQAMKYFLAILACFGVVVAYILIGAGVFGWKHGGGVIPMLILFAALGAIWRKMTKSTINDDPNNAQCANSPKKQSDATAMICEAEITKNRHKQDQDNTTGDETIFQSGAEMPLSDQNQMTAKEKQKIAVKQTTVTTGTSEERTTNKQIPARERQATWFGFSILVVALMVIPLVYFSSTPKDTQADIPSHQQYQDFSTPSSQLVSHSGENGLSPRDSRFALIKLPLGISIEVPKNWLVIDGELNTTIETGGEAIYRLTGMELPTSQKVNLFRANSSPPTTYASIAINVTNSDISPAELIEADEAEIREITPFMHKILDQGLATQNYHIIQFDTIVREIVDGHPALAISYIRSGQNGPVAVQMTRIFAGNKEISLNLSYRLSEIQLWKPIVDYMKATFQINWPNAVTRYSE